MGLLSIPDESGVGRGRADDSFRPKKKKNKRRAVTVRKDNDNENDVQKGLYSSPFIGFVF
jgi:hypothetical protein